MKTLRIKHKIPLATLTQLKFDDPISKIVCDCMMHYHTKYHAFIPNCRNFTLICSTDWFTTKAIFLFNVISFSVMCLEATFAFEEGNTGHWLIFQLKST